MPLISWLRKRDRILVSRASRGRLRQTKFTSPSIILIQKYVDCTAKILLGHYNGQLRLKWWLSNGNFTLSTAMIYFCSHLRRRHASGIFTGIGVSKRRLATLKLKQGSSARKVPLLETLEHVIQSGRLQILSHTVDAIDNRCADKLHGSTIFLMCATLVIINVKGFNDRGSFNKETTQG